MPALYKYTEGWTEPIVRTLTRDGAAFDATGFVAPDLVVVDIATGQRIDTTGDVAWVDESVSKVKFTPDPGDIVPGKYRVTWLLTTSEGVAGYPNGDPEIWHVRAL